MTDALTDAHHDWISSFFGVDLRKEAQGAWPKLTGSGAPAPTTPAPAPALTATPAAPPPPAQPGASPPAAAPAPAAAHAASPAGGFDPTGTLDFPYEVKGPKTAGIMKLNKASFKVSVKIAVSGAPSGDVNVGPMAGVKSDDKGSAAQVGVTADAKRTAQTELTKRLDAMVNGLVKAVTDKDGALKTEVFGKAKAEAKGGAKDASLTVGYDFGIDATVFGVGKKTITVKFTLAGLKYKPSEKPPVSATVMAVGYSDKTAIKAKKLFNLGGTDYDVEGSVEIGVEFEPNWAEIAKDTAELVGETAASAAIMTATDAAALAGPPLLAAAIIAQGIVMAGEKGERDGEILKGAKDAKQAALSYALTITGSEGVATGPRSAAAVAEAKKQLAQVASSQNMSVEDVMTELRKQAPHPDFVRIYQQARNQAYGAYYGEIAKVIGAWRKEHYMMAAWTTEADDIDAVNKLVAVIFAS